MKLLIQQGQNVAGVFDLLQANRKAVLLTNIVIDSKERKDTFIELIYTYTTGAGNIYTGTCYGYTLTINNADLVTLTQN